MRRRSYPSFDKSHWRTGELATFLGVSRSWIRKQIKARRIHVDKGGRLLWEGEWEHYKIPISEVKRVINELPLPRSGKSYAQLSTELHKIYDAVFEEL